MDKTRFESIKNNPTFLFEYFVEETKTKISLHDFDNLLGMWLFSVVGTHPMDGRNRITNFLKEKFA